MSLKELFNKNCGNRTTMVLSGIIGGALALSFIIGGVGIAVGGTPKKNDTDENSQTNAAGPGTGTDTGNGEDDKSKEPAGYDNFYRVFTGKAGPIEKVEAPEITEYILTESPNYRSTGMIDPEGLMLHSIGVAVTSAKQQADLFGGEDYNVAGVHAFIDSDTGEILHTLPWDQEAWHAGEGKARNYIGVEMCETDGGYYTDDYQLHVTDPERVQYNAETAYKSAVKLFAWLCDRYGFDPLEDGRILSHREGALRGIATQHGDPDEYWINAGTDYTMDGFRMDVKACMERGDNEADTDPGISQIVGKYRESQV